MLSKINQYAETELVEGGEMEEEVVGIKMNFLFVLEAGTKRPSEEIGCKRIPESSLLIVCVSKRAGSGGVMAR